MPGLADETYEAILATKSQNEDLAAKDLAVALYAYWSKQPDTIRTADTMLSWKNRLDGLTEVMNRLRQGGSPTGTYTDPASSSSDASPRLFEMYPRGEGWPGPGRCPWEP